MEALKQGILIGGTGGAIAGLALWLVQWLKDAVLVYRDKRRIYRWLIDNTEDKADKKFRSTKAISSWCNLTQDRVRYICSIHKKIYLSTGKNEDLWSVLDRNERSVYEERGMAELES